MTHLTPAHFERMNLEQIHFFEWLNIELTVQGRLIATLQEQIGKICTNQPNIRYTPDAPTPCECPAPELPDFDRATAEEAIRLQLEHANAKFLLTQALTKSDDMRQALAALIATTQTMMSRIDIEAGGGCAIDSPYYEFAPLFLDVKNAIHAAKQVL